MKPRFALLALALWAVLLPLHAGDETKEPVKPVAIESRLAAGDAPDAVLGGPSKSHTVKLEKDRAYVIDLSSKDFDAFLRLLDAKGTELAADDDGGTGLDSRIAFLAPESGEYKVVVTSFDKKPGKYVLKVRPALEPKTVKLEDGKQTVKDKLDQNDEPPLTGPKTRAKVYRVELKSGQAYIFDLVATGFDAYLAVQDRGGKTLAQDDDGGEGLNSRLRFVPTADGTYLIVATGLGNPLGEFTLTLRQE